MEKYLQVLEQKVPVCTRGGVAAGEAGPPPVAVFSLLEQSLFVAL